MVATSDTVHSIFKIVVDVHHVDILVCFYAKNSEELVRQTIEHFKSLQHYGI